MGPAEAAALIAGAVSDRDRVWADVGAGTGTFTRALALLLGPDARVYAVERDAGALRELERRTEHDAAAIVPVRADFTKSFDLPGLTPPGLDGMLLANALHFVPAPERVLARLVDRVRPGGRVVLVEYDGRSPSPWVPHPISAAHVPALAAAAGLAEPTILATRPSSYGGTLYVAAALRPGGGDPLVPTPAGRIVP